MLQLDQGIVSLGESTAIVEFRPRRERCLHAPALETSIVGPDAFMPRTASAAQFPGRELAAFSKPERSSVRSGQKRHQA